MSNILQTFISGIIFVLILHYSIKHYLLNKSLKQSNNLLKKKVSFSDKAPNIHYIKKYKKNDIDDFDEDIEYNQSKNYSNIIEDNIKSKKKKNVDNNSKVNSKVNLKNEILKYVNHINDTEDKKNIDIKDTKNDDDELNHFFQIKNEDKYSFRKLNEETSISKDSKHEISKSENVLKLIENGDMTPYEDLTNKTSYSNIY